MHERQDGHPERGRAQTWLLVALLGLAVIAWFRLAPPGYGVVDVYYMVTTGGHGGRWEVQVYQPAPEGELQDGAVSGGEGWPQFYGGRRDGRVEEAAIARVWPEGGPPVLWSVDDLSPGYGGASVRGDEVYLLERVDDTFDVLRCFSLATGEERWRFQHQVRGRLSYNGSRSVPTIGERYVIAAGPFGHLYCLDRQARALVWKKNVLKEYGGNPPNWGYSCSPLIYGDRVIVPVLGPEVGLAAFDVATGEVAWESGPLGGGTYVSPYIHDMGGEEQLIWLSKTGGGSQVTGTNAATGEKLWSYGGYKQGTPIPPPTPLGDGYFFVTGGYKSGSVLIRVEKGEGGEYAASEVFRIQREGAQIHAAIFQGGFLYANFNRNDNLKRNPKGLVCIGTDGAIRWETGAEPSIGRGGLLSIGGLLVVLGAQDGVLRLVDPSPEGYRELASAPVFDKLGKRDNNIWAAMAYVDGRLLVRSQNQLRCLDLKMGVDPKAGVDSNREPK